MSSVGYLILAIAILVILLVTFIISFVAYRRTPLPKGCEHLKMDDQKCASCGHSECSFYKGEEKE